MQHSATESPPREKIVFVTVGTTEFDALISAVTQPEVLNTLCKSGYTKLRLQIGRGEENFLKSAVENPESPIHIEYYRFKPNIKQDFVDATLVIGHAGAGTCLEVLELGKPLLVVINEQLHDNHQLELARRLKKDGHLDYCIPEQLATILSDCAFLDNLRPFPKGDPKLFSDWLDDNLFEK